MEKALTKIDYKKWLSPDKNTPSALERVVIDQITQRYQISEAKAFAIISKDYKRDNINLARLSVGLHLSRYNHYADSITTNMVKRLDGLVHKVLKISNSRSSYLKTTNK
jgi:GTP cyclohydrolase FolE2